MEKESPENDSPEMDVIPVELFGALDLLVTERCLPDGFQVVAPVPDFAARLFPQSVCRGRTVMDLQESPFIAHFLEEAESFWRENSKGFLKSEPWVESDASEREYGLEALAVSLGDRKIFVIRMLGLDFEHRRNLLQSARERLLLQRRLEKLVRERTRELALTHDATIEMLASLTETRLPETGGHIMRTKGYVHLLARIMMDHPRFRHFLDEETIDHLHRAAPLHDIGKIGVSDTILMKPGTLTDAERHELMRHPLYGRNAILQAERKLGGSRFLEMARIIAYSHHEKWDGTGYPEGLRGEEIPIPGRIMAVADVYDALVSKRVYKGPLLHENAVALMSREKGSHFDPDLADAFAAHADLFRQIAHKYADFDEERAALSHRDR